MSDFEIPEFEANYYAQMPEEIRDAINFRNSGWNLFKESGGEEGMGDMALSATCLNLMMPDFGDLLCGNPDHGSHNLVYAREAFASSSRMAVACAVTGSWETALAYATQASDVVIDDIYANTIRGGMPDQYRVIFGGQLAIVLAGGDKTHQGIAKDLAKEAAQNYVLSEDPGRVAFPDRQMTQAARDETVAKFFKISKAADKLTGLTAPTFVRRNASQLVLTAAVFSNASKLSIVRHVLKN